MTEGLPPPSVINGYVPEIWSVEKDVIYRAIQAIRTGLEYARECRQKAGIPVSMQEMVWVKHLDRDVTLMEDSLEELRDLGRLMPSKN